jgi:hypothetical protein
LPYFLPEMTERSTTPSTTTSKVGSHIQLIPPMFPVPIIPPLIIVPVAIPPPKSSNSKAAAMSAMTRALLVEESMKCLSF